MKGWGANIGFLAVYTVLKNQSSLTPLICGVGLYQAG